MRRLVARLTGFVRKEDGPTAVEYAVMLALIVVICVASIRRVGRESRRDYRQVSRTIQAANQGS